MEMVHICSLF